MPLPRFSLFPLCLLVASAATIRAQAPPPPAPRPLPTAAPALPGTPGSLPAPVINGVPPLPTPTPTEPVDVSFSFPNAPVADVLHYYEQLSGKHVLFDNSVQGQITVNIANKITRTEAIRILEMALNLNGFAIVPADDNVVKIIGLGKPVRANGVPLFFRAESVPDTEQIITLLVRLNYLEPQETSGMLTQYIPPGSTVGFTPLAKAGSLLITDTGRSVRRLYELIQQIDVSPLSVEDRFIRLERADASKAVEFLNSVFETKGSGAPGNTAPVAIPGTINPTTRRPIRRVGEDGVPVDINALAAQGLGGGINSNGDTLIVGRITLTADVRTNRVHVVTNRRNMDVVERLLADYDAETRFAAPVRRPLLFVSAKDVLPILVQSLTEPGTEGGANGGGGGSTPGATNPSRNGSSNSNNLFNNNNSSSSSSGGFGGGSGGSSNIGSEGLDTQPVDTTPTEATVGNTKLIADQRSNTIIILGGADAREKIREVLDQLDVRAPQVIIRTVIGELSLTDDKEFGLNYLLRSRRGTILSQFNAGQIPTTATPTGTPSGTSGSAASALDSFTTLATGLGSSFSGVGGIIAIGNSLDIIVSALDSTNRFKTVSRPMIFTQNNKKAIIASGQEIAVPTNSVGSTNGSTNGAVGTYTNIEYKSVTLQLEVVPLINSNKEITLDILQKIDSLVAGASTTVNGNPIPTIATRYLKSTVSAPNDSTIVLGGLITQNENKSDNNIPYLSRIPVLGKLLFSTRTRGNDRSELIILMHPEVINTPPLLATLRTKEEDRTYLGTKLEDQIRPLTVRKAIPVTTTTTVVRSKKKPLPVATVPLAK